MNFVRNLTIVAALVFCGTAVAATPAGSKTTTDKAYVDAINQWHADRVTRLKAPDGWLSLVGLVWLHEGSNSVGSASDNDAVLPGGPAHLGTITWADDGTVTLQLVKGDEDVTITDADSVHMHWADSKTGAGTVTAELLDDSHDEPTVVSYGTTTFYLITRDGKKGLRVKDPDAATRTGFTHIDRFPVDKAWRVEARYIPFDEPRELKTANEIGGIDTYPVPGKLVFQRDGKTFTLLPVIEVPGDDELFLMFADRTNGKTTYGAGRTLYIDWPQDGKAIIDFNKAYMAPCAFTPFATCSLTPPENRMDLKVTAGEKKYQGPATGHGA